MRRLFIESDTLDEGELHLAQRTIYHTLEDAGIKHTENIFNEIIDFAWHEPEPAWEAIKRADEIYAYSGLMPLLGYGTYTGAPVVFDTMMQKAIDENITGKSVIFIRKFNEIDWEGIDYKLLDKAFKKNFLYTITDYKLEQVDIDKLVRDLKRR